MLKLPCIKNKCLVYPACKSKTRIQCTPLSNYLKTVLKENNLNENWAWTKNHTKIWHSYIRKYFSRVTIITPEKNRGE